MLETFRLAKFRFTVRAREHIRFPSYKGAAFRGGFGYAFKRVVCVIRGKACDECLLKQKCIYSYIFETPPPEDAEMLRLYPKVPHPFVIEPPAVEKQSFASGEEISFHVILIGHAIDYLPYFIYTFTELGKQGIGQGRGTYDLIQVEGIGLKGEAVPIYHNKTQTLTGSYPIMQASQIGINSSETDTERAPQPNSHNQGERQLESPCQEGHQCNSCYQGEHHFNPHDQGIHQCDPHYQDRDQCNPFYQGGTKGGVRDIPQGNNHNNKITISLLTPLRLRFDGHITDKIEFHILIRNLLRRISSLSYFHCGEKFKADFKSLIEKAGAVKMIKSGTHWFDWKRYSTRQEEWMLLGGVMGMVSYEGDLTEFMPLLKLGEYVHVGKGTSFGLGKYEIFEFL